MNAGVKIQNNMKHFDVSGYELDPDSLKALKKLSTEISYYSEEMLLARATSFWCKIKLDVTIRKRTKNLSF